MGKISVVINVVDAEVETLPRTLTSVNSFTDEIVLVDMTSPDSSLKKIAKKYKAKVYTHKFVPYVEPARNFGISKATGDWVLILDPDEEIPVSLAKKMRQVVDKPEADYYSVPRKNVIFGHWMKHSRWWPDYNIRFFKKGAVSWNEVIHSVPLTQGRGLDLPAEEDMAIVHNNYSSIEQYVERMNRYTTQQAKLLVKEKKKFSWKDLIKKPAGEFLSRYFQGEGYKDGVHGLALSSLQAFSELVLYLKVWQAQKFKGEAPNMKEVVQIMKAVDSDANYWRADAMLKEKGGVTARIKRKFKLR